MKYSPIRAWRWFISVVAVVVGYNSVAISERVMEIVDGHPEIEQIIEEV